MKPSDFIVEGLGEDADAMHKDHEVQLARQDCYNAAKNAIELHKLLASVTEQEGLEGWISQKLTLAADYLNTVKEHLEYERRVATHLMMPEFTFESAEAQMGKLLENDEFAPSKRAATSVATHGWRRGGEATGTSLKGYVTTTFGHIKSVLGAPLMGPSNDPYDKVSCQWVITFKDGTVATIYDYKTGKTPMNEYQWHIGGTGKAVEYVTHLLGLKAEDMYEQGVAEGTQSPDSDIAVLGVDILKATMKLCQHIDNSPELWEELIEMADQGESIDYLISKLGVDPHTMETFVDVWDNLDDMEQPFHEWPYAWTDGRATWESFIQPWKNYAHKVLMARGVNTQDYVKLHEQGVAEDTLEEAVGMMIKGYATGGINDQDFADKIAAKTGGRVAYGAHGSHIVITYPTTQDRAMAAAKIRKMFPDIKLYKTGGNMNVIDEDGVAETSVAKHKALGATKDTTHFIKNMKTGEVVSPHRSRQDAEDSLVAYGRTNPGGDYKIVRARKEGVAEGKKRVSEMTAGGTGAGGFATGLTGGGTFKKTTGVPKKVKNTLRRVSPKIGTGIYK